MPLRVGALAAIKSSKVTEAEQRETGAFAMGEYAGGKEEFAAVALRAAACRDFIEDDADEWVADEAQSCYNCRARRWTATSFVCMRGQL